MEDRKQRDFFFFSWDLEKKKDVKKTGLVFGLWFVWTRICLWFSGVDIFFVWKGLREGLNIYKAKLGFFFIYIYIYIYFFFFFFWVNYNWLGQRLTTNLRLV